jgi:hypothetical protein
MEPVRQLRKALRDDLAQRFPAQLQPTLAMATALHPGLKTLDACNFTNAQVTQTWSLIRKALDQAISDLKAAGMWKQDKSGVKRAGESPAGGGRGIMGMLKARVASRDRPVQQAMGTATGGAAVARMAIDESLQNRDEVLQEIGQYVIMSAAVEDDPLEWWAKYGDCFPGLARVAMSVLVLPASSAGVERFFSRAGFVVSVLRTCLSTVSVEELMFLSMNWDDNLYGVNYRAAKTAEEEKVEEEKEDSEDEVDLLDDQDLAEITRQANTEEEEFEDDTPEIDIDLENLLWDDPLLHTLAEVASNILSEIEQQHMGEGAARMVTGNPGQVYPL